jgi:hypothetical protein
MSLMVQALIIIISVKSNDNFKKGVSDGYKKIASRNEIHILLAKAQLYKSLQREESEKLDESLYMPWQYQTNFSSFIFYIKKKNWFVLSLVVELDEMAGQVLLIIKYSLFLNLS